MDEHQHDNRRSGTDRTAGSGYATATRSDLRGRLRDMGPDRFEHFVADVWRHVLGWDTRVVGAPGDRGVDVIATTEEGDTQVLQAKRYGPDTTIDGPEVQQYASLRLQVEDADRVTIVTTGAFSPRAREAAGDGEVVLVDGDALLDLVVEYDAHPLLAAHFGDADPAAELDDDTPPAERRDRLAAALEDDGLFARIRRFLGRR